MIQPLGGSARDGQPVRTSEMDVGYTEVMYVIIILLILVTATLMLRLRVRLLWSGDRRWLFVGLGRSGTEFDLIEKHGTIHLFGLKIRRFRIQDGKREPGPKRPTPGKKPAAAPRRRHWDLLPSVLPVAVRQLCRFAAGLWRALRIEELEGELTGGFDSPDLTGTAFGYYQAAAAAAPGVVGRFRFVPNWSGPSLAAWAQISVALPLYRLLWQTSVLAWHLPLRDMYKLAIGTKRGG